MAITPKTIDLNFVAETDLSSSQYCVVTRGTNPGQVIVCTTTLQPLGVLQNKPAIGERAVVRVFGQSPVVADGACTYKDRLMVADANGQVDTGTTVTGGITQQWGVGYAEETAVGALSLIKMFVAVHAYQIGAAA